MGGNKNFTLTRTITIDTIEPFVDYTGLTLDNNTVVATNYVYINITSSDPLTGVANLTFTLVNSTAEVNRTFITADLPNVTLNFTSLADGIYLYNVTASDYLGNKNTTLRRTIIIDTTNPLIDFKSDTLNNGTFNSIDYITVNVTITESNFANFTFILSNSSAELNRTFVTSSTATRLNFTGLTDGTYTFNVTITDTAGNKNFTLTRTVTLDSSAPTVSYTDPTPANYTFTSSNSLLINATIADDNPANLTYVLVNSTAEVNRTTITTTTSSNYTINFTSLADDTYRYNVTATDQAGNKEFTLTRILTIDATNPLIDYTDPTQINATNSTNTFVSVNVTITEANFANFTFILVNVTSGFTTELNRTFVTSETATILTFTNLLNGTYLYNVTITDLVGNKNTTLRRTIYINTTATDVDPPDFYNLTESPEEPVTYSSGQFYEFNSTWLDDVSSVWIYFNGTNFTAEVYSRGNNIYSFNRTGLSGGNRTYRWYANDSSNNVNQTSLQSYNISRADNPVDLYLNNNRNQNLTITYPTESNATGIGNGIVNLFRDGVSVTSPEILTLGAANYTYKVNATGNNNFTSNATGVTFTLIVLKGTPLLNLTLNGTAGNITIEVHTQVNITGNMTRSHVDNDALDLYKNETLINAGNGRVSNLSDFNSTIEFNITLIHEESNNYTRGFITRYVIVQDNTLPVPILTHPENRTYSQSNLTLNFTVTDNLAVGSCWYNIDLGNNITLTNCLNATIDLSDGQYILTLYANDTSSNENSTDVTFIIDTTFPLIDYTSPTENNGTFSARDYIIYNITITEANAANLTYILSNSTAEINRTTISPPPIALNFTSLTDDTYRYNVTVTDYAGNKNFTLTREITLDTINPLISFLASTQTNGTFETSTTLLVNVSVTELNRASTLVDIDNTNYTMTCSGTSPDFTCNFTVDLTDGLHTFKAFTNDSAGNANTTLKRSYTIDSTSPTIDYEDPTLSSNINVSKNYIAINISFTETNFANLTFILINSTAEINRTFITSETGTLLNFTSLTDDTYDYNVTITDLAGNKAFTTTRSITLDTTSPYRADYQGFTAANGTTTSSDSIYIDVNGADNITGIANYTFVLVNSTAEINRTSQVNNVLNFTSLTDDTYRFNVTLTDYAGNKNFTLTREITIDATNPLISFISPTSENSTNTTSTTVFVNVSYTEVNRQATLLNWNGTNFTMTCGSEFCNYSFSGLSDSENTYYVWINDTTGNANQTETRLLIIDLTAPVVTLLSPENASTENSTSTIVFTFNVTDANAIINASLILNGILNQTNYTITNNANNTFTLSLANGNYNWSVNATDYAGNIRESLTFALTVNVTADTTSPSISLVAPPNASVKTSKNITFTYNVTDSSDVSNCSLITNNVINITDTSITKGVNQTFNLVLAAEEHTWRVNCTDSENNIGESLTYRFTVIPTEEFSGLTTDLETFTQENLSNITNLILENPDFGVINFTESVNLSGGVDIDTFVNISGNRIEIDSVNILALNKSAVLKLYNLTFSDPRILRDEVVCPSSICTKIDYSGDTLEFNVTSFTVYSAEEPPGPSAPSGGGPGGVRPPGFSISREIIKIVLKQGETKIEKIDISNTGGNVLDFILDIEYLGEFIVLTEDEFRLDRNGVKTVTLAFTASENERPDVYTGRIIIKTGSLTRIILLIIEIKAKSPLFDIKIEVLERFEEVRRGDDVGAEIVIFNLGDVFPLDVNLFYSLRDLDGNDIIFEEETFKVEEQKLIERRLRVPGEIDDGWYLFYARIDYTNISAVSSSLFRVRGERQDSIYIYALIAILSLLLIYLSRRKIKSLFVELSTILHKEASLIIKNFTKFRIHRVVDIEVRELRKTIRQAQKLIEDAKFIEAKRTILDAKARLYEHMNVVVREENPEIEKRILEIEKELEIFILDEKEVKDASKETFYDFLINFLKKFRE